MMSFIASLSDQALDHTVPGDRARALEAGVAPRRRPRAVSVQAAQRVAERPGIGLRDAAVDAVHDELVRTPGVSRRHDGLVREEAFDRDVAVVLVIRGKDYPERAGIQTDEIVVVDLAEEAHARREIE